jgi:hypothetical protein
MGTTDVMKLVGLTWSEIAIHFVGVVIFFVGWYLFGQQRARQKGSSLIIGAWTWVVIGWGLTRLVSQVTNSAYILILLLVAPWLLYARCARLPKQPL